MGQAISEILPLAIGVANMFAHLGALSLVFHLLLARVLVVGGIMVELVVLSTLWPGPNITKNSPDHRSKLLGAGKGM